MKVIFLLLASFLLLSCSNNSTVGKKLSGSDSLVINFNDISTNEIRKTVTTTELNAIKKLGRFVAGKETEAFKCGYNGNLLFYEKGNLVSDVSFNYLKGCAHFVLAAGEKLVATEMSNEAVNFLKSLEEGKDWY